jgi:membrane protease YdiL (CAAX protease family)
MDPSTQPPAAPPPEAAPATPPARRRAGRPALPDRARALVEVLIVTLGVELLVSFLLIPLLDPARGIEQLGAAGLTTVVLVKNVLLPVALIAMFLGWRGGLRDLGFGRRDPTGEVLLGLLLFLPLAWVAGLVVQGLVRLYPRLHNVEGNPLLDLIRGPGDAALFLLVSVLAGGVGEETVRAFVLRRFERYLGGVGVGLVVWSPIFGLLHGVQGFDKAVAVGVLGLLLGALYVWRRDPLAPITAHAAFDAFQTLMAWLSSGGE